MSRARAAARRAGNGGRPRPSVAEVRADFDEIAQLAAAGASGMDRFDQFLLSLVPERAVRVLDVGCGLGRLTWAIAESGREVVGVDLSARMLERASAVGRSLMVSFQHGDFLTCHFDTRRFDCIISAAALHHMDQETAVARMRASAIRRLPVVEDGRPVGILALGDLAAERDPGSVLGEISAAPPSPTEQ